MTPEIFFIIGGLVAQISFFASLSDSIKKLMDSVSFQYQAENITDGIKKDLIERLASAERALDFYAKDSAWITLDGIKPRDIFLMPKDRCVAEKDWGTVAKRHFAKYPEEKNL